ncbi:DNA repair protein RecO [Proteiniclasticum ruminis]|uniref:DNA repair protein RecO n=1 Tax=Proteiniclasticum ruminis TaxID=398199 RepID=A0A1I4YP24_9CLOT|nr:DNA repair protein RecO [Proteiniclasticum ruminis]SFN39785.1 DNA repair protein RecO [Proteiniclasticum ruminis]
MQVKAKGIVIKTMDYKEKDKILWIFTEELGKVSVLCKGARSPKYRYQFMTRPMIFGDFLLFKGKSLYNFNEGTLIHGFSDVTSSLELLTYASYFLEMIDIVTLDEEVQPYLYRNLVTALYLLESEAIDVEVITLVYEIKLITLTGYRIGRQSVPFAVSNEALQAAEFFLRNEYAKSAEYRMDHTVKSELQRITSFIIRDSYQRKPKSLDLLKYM